MPPRKPRAPKAAALPPQLPAGMVLTDIQRQTWRLGDTIGSGGFGQIYSAVAECGGSAGGQYVIKVEAHASGPLFTEMHCYYRVARAETIAAWQRRKGLRRLGMPRFVGSGSLDYKNQKFRFMVIERFGTDLQKLLVQNNNRFPLSTILHIGKQVIDVLEFIHSQEYVHGDIKGQNLLLGLGNEREEQVYLVDFGLACRYASDGVHKENKWDARKAHNGTIEFTSRDAHIGAASRRGDLEILGYNLLQWASGTLPWMDRLQNADQVAAEKKRLMDDVPALVRACFPDGLPQGADAIQRFLSAVAGLRFEETPDYAALQAILQAGLRSLGNPPVRLVFSAAEDGSSGRLPGHARDRSPLQPVQESAVPSRRRAVAKKPARRRRPAPAQDEEGADEDEEEREPAQTGAGRVGARPARRAQKRPSTDGGEEDVADPAAGHRAENRKKPRASRKTAAAGSSSGTSSSTSGSPTFSVNLAIQEVLDRRNRAGKKPAARGRPAAAKLAPAPARTAAGGRPGARGRAAAAAAAARARGMASPSARPVSPDDEGESFHTPPSTFGARRSARLSGGGGSDSGHVALARPRRAIRSNGFSPEL